MDSENDSATLSLACSVAHGCPKKAQVRQKKKSAVKFFLCFRSDDVVFPRVVPVVSSSTTTSDSELDVVKCSNQQRKPGRHGFFHVLKAILFKTALVKKIQQRKSGKSIVNIPTKESSGQTQEWSDHEDVPRRIIKTTYSGGNSVFTYVREKEEAVFPTMPSSLLDNVEQCQDQWINRGRRRLFCVLKAVLFETSLAKKIQARKLGKKYGSNGSLRSSTGESCEEDHHDPRKLTKSASSLTNSSVFTSSSLASCSSSSTVSRSTSHSRSLSERIKSFRSISSSNLKANLRGLSEKIRSNSSGLKSNSRYLYERNKMSLESITSSGLREEQHAHFDDDMSTHIEKNNKKGGCYRSASGLCFLLMSLLGLIFYGKLCAILCTSMWLICVPLWSFGDHNWSTNNVVVEKKKVLMGGGMPARTARTRTFRSQ